MKSFLKNIILLAIPFSFLSCEGDNINVFDYDKIVPIVPDIQFYTNDQGQFHYLNSIVQFLKDEKNNICFSIQ